MKTNTYKKSHAIFTKLRDRIVYLEYAPGTVLSEKELCAEFNVSRTPLREVILKLEEMKLILSVPRFGTCVTHIDTTEIRSTYEVKMDLERLAGSLAAERITDTEIKKLESISREAIQAVEKGDKKKGNDCDGQFHKAIWLATSNEILTTILINLHARCRRFCHATIADPGWALKAVEDFEIIVDALKKRDKELAADLLGKHNRRAIEYIGKSSFNWGKE